MPFLTLHYRKGLTLIELLIVISIVAILAVLVLAQINKTRVNARNARGQSEISIIAQSVEHFKVENDDRPLLVQQPYAPDSPGSIEVMCFNASPDACFPTNAILPVGNNGFTDYLFNGSSSSPIYNDVKVSEAVTKSYAYAYMTEDCSMDSIATSGNHHKTSKYAAYMVATGLTPNADGSSPDNFWIRDGTAGRGPDTAVPLLPFTASSAITIPGLSGTMTNCQYNYP